MNISIQSIKINTIASVGSLNIGTTILCRNRSVTVNQTGAGQGEATAPSKPVTPGKGEPFTSEELPGEGVPFGGVVPNVSDIVPNVSDIIPNVSENIVPNVSDIVPNVNHTL